MQWAHSPCLHQSKVTIDAIPTRTTRLFLFVWPTVCRPSHTRVADHTKKRMGGILWVPPFFRPSFARRSYPD